MKIKAAVLGRMGVVPPHTLSRPLVITDVELDGPGSGESTSFMMERPSGKW